MSDARSKMLCSPCGVELNHHAEKPVEPVTREEATQMDPILGVLVEEAHTCPKCGGMKSRRAH